MRLRARGSQEAAKKRCSEEGGPRQVAAARERGEERGPGKFVIGAKDSRNIRGCGVNGRANEGAGNILMYHLSHPVFLAFSNLSNFISVHFESLFSLSLEQKEEEEEVEVRLKYPKNEIGSSL